MPSSLGGPGRGRAAPIGGGQPDDRLLWAEREEVAHGLDVPRGVPRRAPQAQRGLVQEARDERAGDRVEQLKLALAQAVDATIDLGAPQSLRVRMERLYHRRRSQAGVPVGEAADLVPDQGRRALRLATPLGEVGLRRRLEVVDVAND